MLQAISKSRLSLVGNDDLKIRDSKLAAKGLGLEAVYNRVQK